jgi:hypothetical protein
MSTHSGVLRVVLRSFLYSVSLGEKSHGQRRPQGPLPFHDPNRAPASRGAACIRQGGRTLCRTRDTFTADTRGVAMANSAAASSTSSQTMHFIGYLLIEPTLLAESIRGEGYTVTCDQGSSEKSAFVWTVRTEDSFSWEIYDWKMTSAYCKEYPEPTIFHELTGIYAWHVRTSTEALRGRKPMMEWALKLGLVLLLDTELLKIPPIEYFRLNASDGTEPRAVFFDANPRINTMARASDGIVGCRQ